VVSESGFLKYNGEGRLERRDVQGRSGRVALPRTKVAPATARREPAVFAADRVERASELRKRAEDMIEGVLRSIDLLVRKIV